MIKIGVIVAMKAEQELVEAFMENREEKFIGRQLYVRGEVGEREIIMIRSGIGKVNAAVGALEMIRNYNPDIIVNLGVAGAIDSNLKTGDVVVGEEVVYYDVWCGEGNAKGAVQGLPDRFYSDRKLVEIALSSDVGVNVLSGLICSGDHFVTDREELDAIKADFPEGLAVDMESCAIGHVCYLYDTPFLSYRVISDIPGEENHGEKYEKFWRDAPRYTFTVLKSLISRIGEFGDKKN